MTAGQTPSQTVGPFFAYGLVPQQYGYDFGSLFGPAVAEPWADGEHLRIVGQVLDGDGAPVDDALVEIAHAGPDGRCVTSRADAIARGFRGFGRAGTGASPDRCFAFSTVRPGAIDASQAPHVDVILTMRGLLSHAFTRIYFDDRADANARDPVLALVPPERRATLVAQRVDEPGGLVFRFDIRMQGPRETVFFDW